MRGPSLVPSKKGLDALLAAFSRRRLASEAGHEEKVVIYERSPLKLTLVGMTAFASAALGMGAGAYITNKALYDPAVPEHKRSILTALGLSTMVLFPGLLIPFWRLFGKGYGTRLVLNRRTNVLDVQTVGFIPGTKVIESYNVERHHSVFRRSASIHVLAPRFKEKSVLTTPSIVFRRNNGDPRYADNLKSYMFERGRGWFKDEALFKELSEGRFKPHSQ